MKQLFRNRFSISALNTVAVHAINSVSGVWHEMQLADGEKQLRYRLSAYGEFPGVDVNGNKIMQIVDREAGETMAANFNSLGGKIAQFFKGTPIYEGHADDAAWVKANPGHRASAVGRIKSIEPEADGIYVTSVLNSDGVSLLGGDAPKYSGHSPFWRLVPVAGRSGFFRPVLLWSDALTNNPNIMNSTIALNALGLGETPAIDPLTDSPTAESGNHQQATDDMKLTPAALAALGLAPDATPTPDEISAAIVKMCSDKQCAEADKVTAETATTAANSRAGLLDTELRLVRGAAVETVVAAAVTSGRITEAEKPAWTNALNTSFATEAEKLSKLMPVLNTASKLPGALGERKSEIPLAEGIDAMNTAVREIAAANHLDLTKTADYDKAHQMARVAKPELFKRG